MQKLLKKNIYILLYLGLSLFVLFWFKGNDFIGAGDSRWPIKTSVFYDSSKYIWAYNIAPGQLHSRQIANVFPWAFYGTIFEHVGLSSGIYQRFVYVVSFFFSGYGMYLLLIEMKARKFGAFIGGLFYMFSNYALIIVWNPSYGVSFPFYTFFPLSAFFFLKYLRKDNQLLSIDLFLGNVLLFLSFFGMSFNNPVFYVLFVSLLLPFGIYLFLTDYSFKFSILVKKYILFLILFSLLSSFRLFPFAATLMDSYNSADNVASGLIDDGKTQILNSLDLETSFIGAGFWAEQGGHNEGYYYSFRNLLSSDVFLILSFLLVVTSLGSFTSSKSKALAIFLLVFLLGILLNYGSKDPLLLGRISSWFYDAPFIGRAFRSVYLKLGILLILPVSIFISFSLTYLKKSYVFILGSILIGVILYKCYPFITGDIISSRSGNLPGHSFTLPKEYEDLISYLNASKEGKVLSLPIPPSYNYLQVWDNSSYNGIYFMPTAVNKEFFYLGTNPIVKGTSTNLDINTISTLGIRYVLLHKDIPEENLSTFLTPDMTYLSSYLSTSNSLSSVMSTKYFDLYEVSDEWVYPEIFLHTLDANSSVKYVKHSPVLYTFNLPSISTDTALFLNESSNLGWKLYLKQGYVLGFIPKVSAVPRSYLMPEGVLSYLNSWELSKTDIPSDYIIVFLPQVVVIIGTIISMLAFSISLSYIFVKDWNKKHVGK